MAKALTQTISDQISNKDIGITFVFKIGGTDYTSYVKDWSRSFDRKFGSATASFVLDNDDERFSSGGSDQVDVGDEVEIIEKFTGDTTEFKSFFGRVEQRSLGKSSNARTITLQCLDYISLLQHWDIDLESEGTKVKITNENLKPNFLPDPNSMFSQLFDFSNNAIADNPRPILAFKEKNHQTEELQNDGFDILYDQGQVKLGSPLNARDNYDLIARQYYFYTLGLNVEDILETILTTADGYGKFLFGEASAQAVIDNHLKSTFQDEEGAGVLDTMTPNVTSSTITISHKITSSVSEGDTTITLDSVDGLPASGTATLNGDTFTWTNIVAHTKTLTGIPSSGSNGLKEHPINSYIKYEATYAAGRVWYLEYTNVTDTLTSSNFTVPAGSNFTYFDARNGRIILDKAISTSSFVRCDYNYTFKTLQASGIELNKITFRSRELNNRFDAIQKLRSYVAPNYIIRTQGDNKIWASYLSQKTTADYTLDLIEKVNYLEDEDLYTRVKFFGKNKNPTNLMFSENVDFLTVDETYRAIATQNVLAFDKTENGWHIFKTQITDAGYIVLDQLSPSVFINGIPIDNTLRQMVSQPVTVEQTTRTETTTESSKWGGTDVTVRTYHYYKIHFAHQNIEPSQSITLYNPVGVEVMTISPNDGNMDYGRGIYHSPGNQQNSTLESISTSTYYILYSTRSLEIDYDNVQFRIHNSILPNPQDAEVSATYEYFTVFTPARGVGAIMDGRWDTQVQTEFFAQPPSGFNYAIIDLGSTKSIQALDLVAGFYKPDEFRKFDIDMRLTLHYSTDNINYQAISEETHNFSLAGGDSISFDEDQLGVGFQARYLKIILEHIRKIPFGENGVYAVAFTEVAVYDDVILSSESTLIATTDTTSSITSASTTIPVTSTSRFTEPSSGGTQTGYIGTSGDSFTYTGMTSTSFTGCVISSGVSAASGTKIYQSLEADTTLYDDDNFLEKLGDRLYKDVRISDQLLYTQSQLDNLSKNFLKEFYKDHTKISVDVMYAPYLKVGQTISLTDTYNNISGVNYFIERITDNNGSYNLILARFP